MQIGLLLNPAFVTSFYSVLDIKMASTKYSIKSGVLGMGTNVCLESVKM